MSLRSGVNIDATGLASLTSNRNISLGGVVTGNRGRHDRNKLAAGSASPAAQARRALPMSALRQVVL